MTEKWVASGPWLQGLMHISRADSRKPDSEETDEETRCCFVNCCQWIGFASNHNADPYLNP